MPAVLGAASPPAASLPTDPVRPHGPSRPRLALLVFAGVYPLVTGLLYLLFPLTEGWTLWQRTLVLVPVIVTCMVWGIIPAIHRHFGAFIARR